MSRTAKSKINDAVTFAMQSMRLDKCQAHHFGPWQIEPEWFKNALSMVNNGTLKAQGDTVDPDGDDDGTDYQIVGGTAVIPVSGPMMKARSKFGGTSTIDARNQVRKAASDARVSSIMLHIDSPGGTVAGTDALADDVAYAASQKPTYAHISDMGASAAYYVASQADRITASRGSLVGSLGTRMLIVDSSAAYAKDGYKAYDISTGEFKGAGADGTPISESQLAYFQSIVDAGNAHFKAAVMRGRNIDQSRADALFDGKVHDAQVAQTLGLIDQVCPLDDAMAALQTETQRMNAESFQTYAAEHPEAVAGFIEQGRKAGIADGTKAERDRSAAVIDAAGTNVALAIEGIKAGHDADTVKLAADAAAKAKAEADAITAKAQEQAEAHAAALKAAHEAHAKEKAELEAKIAAMPRGNDAASFSAEPTNAPNAAQQKKLAVALGSENLARFAAGITLPTAKAAVLPESK